MLLLAGEAPALAVRSNFRLDQAALASTVGAASERLHSGARAADDVARAFHRAHEERRPVLLSMPLDVQAEPASLSSSAPAPPLLPSAPSPATVAEIADLIAAARRPVIIAGRGAVLAGAREALEGRSRGPPKPRPTLTVDHIREYEASNGPLPDGGRLLLRTGWDARAHDEAEFLNANETGPHTPGFDVECAR